MYRPQKHIYDLTRHYYLLGRDRLIARARPDARARSLLDIGCGTGRNLALIGQRYPAARLLGLDAAAPMLEIADARLKRAGVQATLAHGVAESPDAGIDVRPSGRLRPRHDLLLPVHGRRSGEPWCAPPCIIWPQAARCTSSTSATWRGCRAGFVRAMAGWLARFHVHHRPEVEATLRQVATEREVHLELLGIAGRYAMLQRLSLRRPQWTPPAA